MAKEEIFDDQKTDVPEISTLAMRRRKRITKNNRAFATFVLVIAFISQTLSMGFFVSYGTIYVELIKIFKISETTAAWIGSIAIAVCFGIGIITSLLIKKCGDGAIISLGGVVLGLGLILCSMATNTLALTMAFSGVTAIGCSFLFFASFSVLPHYFTSRLCIALSITSAGCNFSGVTFSPLMVYLIKKYSFKTCFQVFSSATLIPILGGLVVQKFGETTSEGECKQLKKSKSDRSYRTLFTNKRLMIIFLAMALVELCYYIPYVHLVNFGIHNGVSMMKASWLTVTLSIGALAGKILFGMVGQIKYVNVVYLFQIFLLGMAVCLTLLPLATNYPHLMMFSAIYGMFDGGFACFILPLVASAVPADQVSIAFGALYTFISVELLFGAPLAGLIYTYTSSYAIPFLLCGGSMLTASLILFWLPAEKMSMLPVEVEKAILIEDEKEEIAQLGLKKMEGNSGKENVHISNFKKLLIKLKTEYVLSHTSKISQKLLQLFDLIPRKLKEKSMERKASFKSKDIMQSAKEDVIHPDKQNHETYSSIDDSFDQPEEIDTNNNKRITKYGRHSYCKHNRNGRTVNETIDQDHFMNDEKDILSEETCIFSEVSKDSLLKQHSVID